MSELSIFIDESGDFGTYDIRSPYYIITMVFHDQSCDISEPIAKLRRDLSNLGIDPDHSSVFNALLPRIEIKRVLPSDYRLFQAADMFCSMELITLKLENSSISASEMEFFGNLRDLKKNYLKPLAKFEWK